MNTNLINENTIHEVESDYKRYTVLTDYNHDIEEVSFVLANEEGNEIRMTEIERKVLEEFKQCWLKAKNKEEVFKDGPMGTLPMFHCKVRSKALKVREVDKPVRVETAEEVVEDEEKEV